MTRPVALHIQPVFHPHVCIRCGCGTGQRDYFIELGINLAGHFNPYLDGNIYYCDQCAKNLIVDISRLISKREEETAPWTGDGKADVTYDWENQIDLSSIEAEIERTRVAAEPGDTDSEPHDTGVEQISDPATSPIEFSEPAVSTVFSDDAPGSIGGFSFDYDPES